MAKGGSKKKKNSTKGIGRFRVEMTNGVRLLLIACFILGFAVVGFVVWWTGG
jgi:hypothetical protein